LRMVLSCSRFSGVSMSPFFLKSRSRFSITARARQS
jgi:hypothetical protein